MVLPKEITPGPVTSTIEVRFKSKIDKQKILPKVLSKLYAHLPDFSETNLPDGVRELDIQLRYYPDYILKNDDYSVSFSDKALSFENVGSYKLWGNYFPFIKENLKAFYDLDIIDNVERIGLRYAGVFSDETKVEDILNDVPNIKIKGNAESFSKFSSSLSLSGYKFVIQLNKNHTVELDNQNITGLLIDIDASKDNNDNLTYDKVVEIIDELHKNEKEIFFSLLKDSFIEKLNPKY